MTYFTDERRYFAELADHGHKKRLLFEGDSWFSIPDLANIPLQFEQQQDVSILCQANPGNTLAEQVQGHQLQRLTRLLHDDQFGQKWDAIFLSVGGNDVIGPDIEHMLKAPPLAGSPDPLDYLDPGAIELRFGVLRDRLNTLLAVRNSSRINRTTPLFMHSYARVTPRDAAHKALVWNLAGPWIYPRLLAAGIVDCALQTAIVSTLLDRFFALLQTLAEAPGAGLHLIDVRDVLPRPDCASRNAPHEFWADEIHPSAKGFELLARQCFFPALQAG